MSETKTGHSRGRAGRSKVGADTVEITPDASVCNAKAELRAASPAVWLRPPAGRAAIRGGGRP
jgi:hypothetical protein